jgi:hypothetical protein
MDLPYITVKGRQLPQTKAAMDASHESSGTVDRDGEINLQDVQIKMWGD